MIAPAWISGTEILVALFVGLLVFGGRLPEVMKDVGRWFFRLKRELEEIRRDTGIDETLRELQSEGRSIVRDLEKTAEETRLPALDPHAPALDQESPPEDAELDPEPSEDEGWVRREPDAAPEDPEAEDHPPSGPASNA